MVRGSWLVACAEAGKLLPADDGGIDGAKLEKGNEGAGKKAPERREWSLSVLDLGALVRSASAAAVTNAAANAAAAAAATAATGVAGKGGNNAANANGGAAASAANAAAAAAAAAAATAGPLPLAGLHFTLAAMTAPKPNSNASSNNSENAAGTAALRTELAKAGARTFDARTTSGVPRDAAYALCPPGLSPEAAGILDRRPDW